MILLLNKENWLALYVAIVYARDISPEQAIELVTESTYATKRGNYVRNDASMETRMRERAEKCMEKVGSYFDRFSVGDIVELQSKERPSNKFRLLYGKVRGVVIFRGRYLSVRGDNGVVITVNYSDVLEKKIRVRHIDVDIKISKDLGVDTKDMYMGR